MAASNPASNALDSAFNAPSRRMYTAFARSRARVIFPIQIQAARVLLDFSQQELAKRASIGLGTVKRIEAARHQLVGTAKTMSQRPSEHAAGDLKTGMLGWVLDPRRLC